MDKPKLLPGLPSDNEVEELAETFGTEAVMCYLAVQAHLLREKSDRMVIGPKVERQWTLSAAWLLAKFRELEARLDG